MSDNRQGDPGRTHTAEEHNRMLAGGTVLAGRYRVEALSGVGGMGMVYRAHDLELDIPVALKVMRPERGAEQQMLDRFRRELVLARQVTHRNVVRIHDIGSDEGRLFLTMDYIEGRSLADLLSREGSLSVARAVNIAAQLARALAAAHAEGIVHRDLKPANVLVNGDDRAFVTDFGIARSLAVSGMTETGSILGTPDYLSPEQARGEEVDGRTDIYALGLILYRMLTDELPFSGDTYEEILAQHTAGHVRDISRSGVSVPKWLRRLLARCLQRDPADRYQDAGELAEDLERHASHWRMGRRPRRALAAMLVVVAVGGLLLWRGFPETVMEESSDVSADIAKAPRHSVAVLPLAHAGGSNGWIVDGLAELLAAQLAESPELQVVEPGRLSRTLDDLDIRREALSPGELRQVIELLDIDRVVIGTVVGEEEAFRIQLRVLLAEQPELPSRTLTTGTASSTTWLAAVDELSDELRGLLEVSQPPIPAGQLTDSLAALEAYTVGVESLRDGDSLAAVPQLKKAVEADADFVAAWVALSNAHASLGHDTQALDAARTAVDRLKPESGRWAFEARAQEAMLAGDPATAEQYLRQLVETYPHDMETQVRLAEILGDAGGFDEAIRILRQVTQQDPNHPRAYYLLGKFSILMGDSQRAVDDYLVRALVIQNKLDNDQGRADVFNALGIAWHQLGKLEQARDYYQQAADLRESIGDERGVIAAITNIARLQMLEGDYAEARRQFEEAVGKLEAIGDRHGLANMHNELGVLEEELGDYSAALARYRNALQIRERLGNRRATAESYNNVGYAYYLLGQYDNAAVYLGQALEAYREMENPDGRMQALQTVGLLETARGNWHDALKSFLDALEIARAIDIPHAAAVSHGNLGYIAQLQGRYSAAAEAYDEAVRIMRTVGDPRGLAEFSLLHAGMVLDLGMPVLAREHLEVARGALDVAGNLQQAAWFSAIDARADLLEGNSSRARERMEEALSLAGKSGSELTRLRVGIGLVEILLHEGEIETALEQATRYRRAAEVLGNMPLRLRARRLEAEAALLSDDAESALAQVRDTHRLVRGIGDYAGSWHLHRLAAELADEPGEMSVQQERARQEVARVRQNMNEEQRGAFDTMYPGALAMEEGSEEHAAIGQ